MRRIVTLLVSSLLALLVSVRAASAADDPARARDSFDRGMTHYNVGEYRDALAQFKDAYFAKHDPVFLFNMGQCYRQLGEPESAVRQYRAYLRVMPGASNRADVERFIAQAEADRATAGRDAADGGAGAGGSSDRRQRAAEGDAAHVGAGGTSGDSAVAARAVAVSRHRRRATALWAMLGVAAVVVVGGAVGLGVGFGVSLNAHPHPLGPSARVMFDAAPFAGCRSRSSPSRPAVRATAWWW